MNIELPKMIEIEKELTALRKIAEAASMVNDKCHMHGLECAYTREDGDVKCDCGSHDLYDALATWRELKCKP